MVLYLSEKHVDSVKSSHRVLIVDDNVDAAESLAALLQFDGAEARVETDAKAIIEVVKAFDPMLVLLDLELPDIDGLEACRRIRRAKGREVYVAALTGWSREQDVVHAREAGFDAHVVKPIGVARLKELVTLASARRATSGLAGSGG